MKNPKGSVALHMEILMEMAQQGKALKANEKKDLSVVTMESQVIQWKVL